MKRNIITAITLILVLMFVLLLPNYVPGIGIYTLDRPAGLLSGIWHGWISPISLIVGIFKPDVTLYESINSGWWYDFGFYISIIGGFGGLTLFRGNSVNSPSENLK